MQDQYTGDIGDFGKYGLLRALRGFESRHLRLGVIWYRTDASIVDADPPNDGKHVEYLLADQTHRFRPCDPPLFDTLRELVATGNRRVATIAQSRVLGADTQFHESYVPVASNGVPGERDPDSRHAWARRSRFATRDCQIVFVDPDNGFAPISVSRTSSKAPKYVFLDELAALYAREQSLVIYHHFGRRGTHRQQIAHWREVLHQHFRLAAVYAFRFRRISPRVFFVVAAAAHLSLLQHRVDALSDSEWFRQGHFELIP